MYSPSLQELNDSILNRSVDLLTTMGIKTTFHCGRCGYSGNQFIQCCGPCDCHQCWLIQNGYY